MRRFAFVIVLVCVSSSAFAQIPDFFSYQGMLEDSLGVPVPDGVYDFTFRLYRFPNDQTILHEESVSLNVFGGRFWHYLGSAANMDPSIVDGPLWLGIAVNGLSEMGPRTLLGSTPFAWYAKKAQFAESAPPPVIDHAGAASEIKTNTASLNTGSFQNILSATISVPHSGPVLVMATCELGSVSFNDISVELGVSDSPTTLAAHRDIDVIQDNGNLGTHSLPVTVHGMFLAENAGQYTYYLLARELQVGDNFITNVQLSVVFLPSMYGAIITSSVPEAE